MVLFVVAHENKMSITAIKDNVRKKSRCITGFRCKVGEVWFANGRFTEKFYTFIKLRSLYLIFAYQLAMYK